MAYIHCSEEFLSDDYCMDALSEHGIKLENQRPTVYNNIWAFDVSGEPIPDTDKQVVVTIYSNNEISVNTA